MEYLKLAYEILESGLLAGVRSICPDEQYEEGDYCRQSYEWDFENDISTFETTKELARGTCATNIDLNYFKSNNKPVELALRIQEMIDYNKSYGRGNQIVIVGNQCNNDASLDYNEIRIINARVAMIIK